MSELEGREFDKLTRAEARRVVALDRAIAAFKDRPFVTTGDIVYKARDFEEYLFPRPRDGGEA